VIFFVVIILIKYLNFYCTCNTYADNKRSPLGDKISYVGNYTEYSEKLYSELIPVLPEIIKNYETHEYKKYWEHEYERIKQTEKDINNKLIKIEDDIKNDITLVTLSKAIERKEMHLLPIHNNTKCYKTLLMQPSENFYSVIQRYESKIDYQSAKPSKWVSNWDPLIATLNELEKESDKGIWEKAGPSWQTKVEVAKGKKSSLTTEKFKSIVTNFLGSYKKSSKY